MCFQKPDAQGLGLRQVVEEGWPQSGVASEIMAIATEEAFDYLDAAPERITGAEAPPTPPVPSLCLSGSVNPLQYQSIGFLRSWVACFGSSVCLQAPLPTTHVAKGMWAHQNTS